MYSMYSRNSRWTRNETGEEVGDMMVFGSVNCGKGSISLSVGQEAIRGF